MGRNRQQTVTGFTRDERVKRAIQRHEQEETLGRERRGIRLKLLLLTPRQREQWSDAVLAGNKKRADEILGCGPTKYSIT